MSDAVLLSLISGVFALLTTLLAWLISVRQKTTLETQKATLVAVEESKVIVEASKAIALETHSAVNSRLDKALANIEQLEAVIKDIATSKSVEAPQAPTILPHFKRGSKS